MTGAALTLLAALLVVAPVPEASAQVVSFGAVANYPTAGSEPQFVADGDFDGDGTLDLVTADNLNDEVSVLLGTGTGTFGTATAFPVQTNPRSVAVADLDHDNNLDLVVGNFGSNSVSVLLGTGTGSFGTATNFTAGTGPQGVVVRDFNRDGNLDLATSNLTSSTVTLRLGTGTGSFGSISTFGLNGGTSPYRLAVGDFDNNGNPDLAIANSGTDNVSILLGTGTACTGVNCFGTATNFSVGTSPRQPAVGDFDADGDQDLAVTNLGDDTVSVLLGSGTGGFGTATDFAVGDAPYGVAVADVDLDGRQDLAVADSGPGVSGNQVSILLGTGTGSFGTATGFSMGTGPQAVTVGNFDGDDWPDVATANNGSDNVSVRLNDTAGEVLSITIPTGIVDLGSGTTAGAFSAKLGAVTVTDNRPGTHTWTMTVTATDFTTGAGGPTETIGNGRLSYWSGAATATSGDGVFTPGQLTALQAVPLSTAQTAFTHSSGTVVNSATWNPTIIVNPPPTAVAGTYSGTILHSVS